MSPKALVAAFNFAVCKAWAAETWERSWPRAAPVLCVGGLFLTASWVGAWSYIPVVLKMASVGFLGAAGLSAPFWIKGKNPFVSKKEALQRIDDHINDPKISPARALADHISSESTATEKTLWQMNLRGIWDKYKGKLNSGWPKPGLAKYDPYGVRYAILAATIVSGAMSTDHVRDVQRAFDWRSPDATEESQLEDMLKVKAWVVPPESILADPLYLDEKTLNAKDAEGETEALVAHEKSVLMIRVYGQQTSVIANGEQVPLKQAIESRNIRSPETIYYYEVPFDDKEMLVEIKNGPTWKFSINQDAHPLAEINDIQTDDVDPDAVNVKYTMDDDYGIVRAEMIMTLAGLEKSDENKDANENAEESDDVIKEKEHKPLPSAALPRLPLR